MSSVETTATEEHGLEAGQDNILVLGLNIHNPVFFVSAVVIVGFVIFTLIFRDSVGPALADLRVWLTSTFDWLFIIAGNLFVLFCLAIVLSPMGRVRIGGADAIPDFGYAGWFSMLFAAGMGIGLMSSACWSRCITSTTRLWASPAPSPTAW